jgi:EpsI family protein
MSRRLRLLAVAVALLVPALVLARWALATASGHRGEPQLTLPAVVGEWQLVEERPLDEDALELIDPDAYTMRLYAAPGRAPVWVYVGLYVARSGSGKGHHDPEVCYPAQGWEILGSRSRVVALPDGAELHGKQLVVHRGSLEESVFYWFQPAGRWPVADAPEQLARVLDAVRGNPQYAFVRLSAAGHDLEALEDELEDVAAALAAEIRRDVEGI